MKTKCQAVAAGRVKHKGKATGEWTDKNGKTRYYCYGYVDKATDYPIEECLGCPKFWERAEEDFEKHYGRCY